MDDDNEERIAKIKRGISALAKVSAHASSVPIVGERRVQLLTVAVDSLAGCLVALAKAKFVG